LFASSFASNELFASNIHSFKEQVFKKVDFQTGKKTRAAFFTQKASCNDAKRASEPQVFLRHGMRMAPGLGFVKAGQKNCN